MTSADDLLADEKLIGQGLAAAGGLRAAAEGGLRRRQHRYRRDRALRRRRRPGGAQAGRAGGGGPERRRPSPSPRAKEVDPEPEVAAPYEPLDPSVDPETWAGFGGWFRQDFIIYYRPVTHRDPFMRAWIDLAAKAHGTRAEPNGRTLMAVFRDKATPGKCTRCHSQDQRPGRRPSRSTGGPTIRSRASGPFTVFNHSFHFSLVGDQGLRHLPRAAGRGRLRQRLQRPEPADLPVELRADGGRGSAPECHVEGLGRRRLRAVPPLPRRRVPDHPGPHRDRRHDPGAGGPGWSSGRRPGRGAERQRPRRWPGPAVAAAVLLCRPAAGGGPGAAGRAPGDAAGPASGPAALGTGGSAGEQSAERRNPSAVVPPDLPPRKRRLQGAALQPQAQAIQIYLSSHRTPAGGRGGTPGACWPPSTSSWSAGRSSSTARTRGATAAPSTAWSRPPSPTGRRPRTPARPCRPAARTAGC